MKTYILHIRPSEGEWRELTRGKNEHQMNDILKAFTLKYPTWSYKFEVVEEEQ